MPNKKRPRRGSLQYWPRKRARRIYTRISYWPSYKDAIPLGFAGWKAGMTHVQYVENNSNSKHYGKVITKSVTILESPSLFVCALKFYKKSLVVGEKWSEKLPKEIKLKLLNPRSSKELKDYDNINLVVCTQPSKSSIKKKKPEVFEIAIGGSFDEKKKYAEGMLGKEMNAKDILKPGEYVDISSVTKGKGFTGPVKRFGIKIQSRKNEQHHRHVGCTGSEVPRKMDWRVPAAGQYGFFNRTEFSKRILIIDDEAKKINPKGGFLGYGPIKGSYIMIEGSLPGHRKRLIRLRKSVRTPKISPVTLNYVSLESKQGR